MLINLPKRIATYKQEGQEEYTSSAATFSPRNVERDS